MLSRYTVEHDFTQRIMSTDWMPSEKTLASILYDPSTGILTWTTGRMAGKRADHAQEGGYRRINLEGKWRRAHRVAWIVMTGVSPTLLIDHIDRDPSNNRWSNLRLADPTQNQANSIRPSDTKKGVTYRRRTGRFIAQIRCYHKNLHLGVFDTEDEAHAAYMSAAKRLFGEYARGQ